MAALKEITDALSLLGILCGLYEGYEKGPSKGCNIELYKYKDPIRVRSACFIRSGL